MIKLAQAGKLDEAVALSVKELAVTREVRGELHEDVVDSLQLLARLQEAREDWAAARKALTEVLAIRERQPDQKDWRIADARRALADLDRRAALDPAQRQRLQEADRLNRLQDALHSQGKYAEGIDPCRKAMEIRGELLGENHPDYRHQPEQPGHAVPGHGGLREGRAALPPGPGDPQAGTGREPPRLCHQPEQPGRAVPGHG